MRPPRFRGRLLLVSGGSGVSRYPSLVVYRAPRPVIGLKYGQAPLLLRFTRQLLLVSWVSQGSASYQLSAA